MRWAWVGKISVGLLLIAFFASLYFETLIPLVREGDYMRILTTSSGILTILLGILFLLLSLRTLLSTSPRSGEDVRQRIKERLEEIKSSQSYLRRLRLYLENLRDATSFLGTPLAWFLVGFLLILLGSYLINL